MKVQQLFTELNTITKNQEKVFAESGMVNWSDKMQYGFFPLGMGILTENNKTDGAIPTDEIVERGVMILGNDFGTITYVEKYFGKIGETDSTTIRNLKDNRVGLNLQKTFFTNYYLGVRDDKNHPGATMIKRVVELDEKYKKLCYNFFIIELKIVNPSMIVCLGHEVKNALIESAESDSFIEWKPKSISIKKIHEKNKHILSNSLGSRRFVVIPHPCDLRNFNETHMIKLNEILNDKF